MNETIITPLQLVKKSPEAAAHHDRDGWLRLFASDAVIEDPVVMGANDGSFGKLSIEKTNIATDIGAFYDTFVRPMQVKFEVHRDIECDDLVIRDVTIHATLSTGTMVAVPTYIFYDTVIENGQRKINRLRAHWQLPAMAPQVLSQGTRGWAGMALMSWNMIKNQGLGKSLTYSQAYFRGVFDAGVRRAVVCIHAVEDGQQTEFWHQCSSDVVVKIDGKVVDANHWPWLEVDTITLDRCLYSGYTVSGRYASRKGDKKECGIALFSFSPVSRRISQIELYRQK